MTKDETQQKLVAMLRKDAYEAATIAKHYADENKQLRAFAQSIMEAWPEGGIEGDDLRQIAAACIEAADWLDKRAELVEGQRERE